jgi:hypothetical protein
VEDVTVTGTGLELSQNGLDSIYRVKVHIWVSDTINVHAISVIVSELNNGEQLFMDTILSHESNSFNFPIQCDFLSNSIEVVIGDFMYTGIHNYYITLYREENEILHVFNKTF